MQNLNYLNHTKEANIIEKISATTVKQLSMDLQCPEKDGTLRKCKECGIEAKCEGDLHNFVANHTSKHGRMEICHTCFNKKYNEKRQRYKNKRIYMKTNIRLNVCAKCGKTREENGRQMALHHKLYILDAPQAFTAERCMSCHNKERTKK